LGQGRHDAVNPRRRTFLKAGAVAVAGFGAFPFVPRTRARIAGGMAGPDAGLGHRFRDGGFPEPSATESTNVLVVGGGIAGLATGRELDRLGRRDWKLLELENELGGNASSGRNAVSEFPWGAHYVPLPGPEAPEVTTLFEELGVIVGRDPRGLPVYREEYLCHDPQERLFVDGRWQEGIVPHFGIGARERLRIEAFLARMGELRSARGNDGKPLFAVPADRSSRDPAWLALDREGFVSPELRWYVDYCCRDDFGAASDRVAAWAGLHYFAARRGSAANAPGHAVVTWPAGNGWIAGRLRGGAGERCVPRTAAFRVTETDGGAEVWAWHAGAARTVRHRARHVVLAVPQFVAARMLGPDGAAGGRASGVYSPWMVANVTLRSMPPGRGAPPAWDNVLRESRSLGYVMATHQSLDAVPRATVLTYYQPLDEGLPAESRRVASGRGWESWRDQILADLGPSHPGIADLVERIDVRVWGHGMICPVPGWLWDGRRGALAKPRGRVHFAHSDLGGMSLFEEACVQGVRAARDVVARWEGKIDA